MLARLAILLSVVFGGTLGTVEAAQRSLPGSALYPVKLQIEDLRTARTQDPQARIERLMQAAEERLEEAERLVRRGNDVPTELGERYAEELSLALEAMDGLSGAARNQAEARIAELLTGHVEAIRELGARLDADDAALGLMMAAVEEAASQLDGFDANVLDDDDMDVVGSDDDDDDGPDDDDADDDGSDDDDDGSDDHDDGDDDSDDDSDDYGDDDGSDDDDDGDDDSDDESDDDSDDDGDDDSDDDGDGDDDSDGDDAADDDDDGDDDGSDDDDDGDDDSDGDDDADDDDDGDDDGSDDDNDGDDHSDDDDADDADD